MLNSKQNNKTHNEKITSLGRDPGRDLWLRLDTSLPVRNEKKATPNASNKTASRLSLPFRGQRGGVTSRTRYRSSMYAAHAAHAAHSRQGQTREHAHLEIRHRSSATSTDRCANVYGLKVGWILGYLRPKGTAVGQLLWH